MKNWRIILFITLAAVGLGLLIWGNVIMMRYEGFREIWKAARHAALPQFISGIVIMVIAYFMTYSKDLYK